MNFVAEFLALMCASYLLRDQFCPRVALGSQVRQVSRVMLCQSSLIWAIFGLDAGGPFDRLASVVKEGVRQT